MTHEVNSRLDNDNPVEYVEIRELKKKKTLQDVRNIYLFN